MAALLVFNLAAPLASFGDLVPGERRSTAARPGHSALIGLIAAALGLKRDDPRQRNLAENLAFAVRVDRQGSILTDYHTTQTAASKRGRRFSTRAQELSVEDRVTILSQREYRSDAAFTIAVLAKPETPFSLSEIETALRYPRFVLSAGRKACALALPPAPQLLEAETLEQAFLAYDVTENAREIAVDSRIPRNPSPTLSKIRKSLGFLADAQKSGFMLACAAIFVEQGLVPAHSGQIELRRDQPVDRLRWQFSQREERVMSVPPVKSIEASA